MNEKTTGQEPGNQTTGPKAQKRFNINTVLSIITLAGVIVLFFLYFMDFERKLDVEPEEIKAIEKTVSDATYKIGFIDKDKLIERYNFAQKLREDMLAEQRSLENDLERRQRNFQQKVEDFQSQAQRGLISMEQAQVKEQELLYEQQQLIMLSEEYSEKLRQKEIDLNVELFDSITSFLKRYNKEYGYDFVLNFSPGGGLLFGGEQYDITEDFIEKINK